LRFGSLGDEGVEIAATSRGTLRGTIVTEYGLHFRKDGDRWRCVERPGLAMPQGGGYGVEGRKFDTLAEAVAHPGSVMRQRRKRRFYTAPNS
jgi:hypothetical protein